MKITLASTFFVIALFHPSYQQCLTGNDLRLPQPNARQRLYSGQQEFSLALLQAIHQLTPDSNIFFSPYSTFQALLLTYFISSGLTEKYLQKVLRTDISQDKADIYNAYKFDRLATKLDANGGKYEFTSANRLYVAEQIKVRDCIIPIFNQELIKTNFQADPEAARCAINDWVQEHTHDMIKDLIPPGSIDRATNLVLVNAAYFKGKWESKFNSDETKPEVFYISPSKQTIVDMMHIESTFNYDVSESLKAHILELPYEGDDISMFILLPPFSKEDSVETVLKRLTLENFQKVVNGSLSPRQVAVSLPKFRLEHTVELVPILESIGVGNLFHQDSDFSVLTGSRDISVGEGIHKAKIQIDEEGTKAAAATSLISFKMLSSDDEDDLIPFRCDRPFVFVLYNKKMKTVLFLGVYRKPEK